ncbi:MAG: glycosyltransferase [Lactobacillus crispatus]|jgi:UDP-N-acetylglucosamine transferase subunit ALG13|nr:glycosyltransferase [Lactobacillus crispatus]MCI1336268.1 glycosyltransferase [Lactobacillus crispatus]MCI1365761.1 glycosyltransferase [Lactobacillus crispatus]MCI1494143.1 glycosyltransferase [Lactobacillus crispatus]MCI1524611.1 glycosyltransferase [Lactobacillus crispatus]
MIFVTVGTHEQPFNRLIKAIDNLVANGDINEKVIVQSGFSTYVPKHCETHKMMSFEEMQQALKDARIVITHGGPSSFIEALQFGKVPIVVPRQEKFNEHVNNHQVDFTKLISERMNNIIPVYDIDDLKKTINNYNHIAKEKNTGKSSNNYYFNDKLNNIVVDLFKQNK